MTYSKEFISYTEHAWERRRAQLGGFLEETRRVFAGCGEEEALLLKYVLATLPLSDLGDYRPQLFLSFVRHALRVREEFSWCGLLPEHMFLKDVLYPRINTEEISDCRELFYGALESRVRGLSLEKAILEVNRWCAEEATYRTTDDRTASPLAVYRCGYGRCGEESTFAVTALRSVGIAARQVYAPRWSHCDDNHAWVEAFDGSRWRYLGACEPEPELDRGWFTGAASRAMLVHARSFVQGGLEEAAFLFPGVDPLDLDLRQGVAYESVTAHYGEVRPITVRVLGEDGMPAPGARVGFSILNMAELTEIAVRETDGAGTASLRLGLGSVWVTVQKDGLRKEALLNAGETDRLEISLRHCPPETSGGTDWASFDFLAPPAPFTYSAPLTAEQKRERREYLDRAAALREKKLAGAAEEDVPTPERRILDTLTEKDLAGSVEKAVLEDGEAAFAWEREYPADVFEAALLCPRVELEPLFPWRNLLNKAFPESEREAFREAPQRVWEWVERNVREEPELYPDLPGAPAGMFRLKAARREGKRALFCALCRSFGIPARLSPLDGSPEYYEAGGFRPVFGGSAHAGITLRAPESQPGLFRQNFTLARLGALGYETVSTGDIPAGECREIPLAAGDYRLLTVSRMPNGNQFARRLEFSLEEGEKRETLLSFREGSASDLLERLPLPPFGLRGEDGAERSSGALLANSPLSLLVWLEVNREPTEHILNELREAADKFRELRELCAVCFLLESPEDRADPTLRRTLDVLPEAELWYGDFQDGVPLLARRMFVDPERLPLILLADREGNGLYACSGYNVGTAELLLRILGELSPRNSRK